MTLLFLDFDGVLHPEPATEDQFFCRVPLLETVLRELPHISIVISSTWRDTRSPDELRGFFSPDIARRIVGVTPHWRNLPSDVVNESAGYTRQLEVEAWLKANEPWAAWVAIDDKPWLYRPFLANLVVTSSNVGLDQESAAKLKGALSKLK